MEPMFDLVTSVWNSIFHIRACAAGVLRNSTLPYHFYVVNDRSTPRNTEEIHEIFRSYDPSSYTIIENEENLGYLPSINKAIEAGSAPYVILVNSDTIPQAGYLEKAKAAFESDESIGIINPVSNWANWTRICWDIPEGFNIMTFAEEVDRISRHELPDIYSASGFFLIIRRKLFDEIGLFDPVYGFGYYEETDFCFRALEANYRVVVDDSMYVFHHGWGSFPGPGRSKAIFQKNKEIFLGRYGDAFKEKEKQWKVEDPCAYMRKAIDKKGPAFEKIDNKGADLWKAKEARIGKGTRGKREEISVAKAQKRLDTLMDSATDIERVAAAVGDNMDAPSKGDKIVYILPALTLYGGNISVLQVVNQLIQRGLDANIATYGKVDEDLRKLFPVFFNAYLFPDKATLISEFPECDLIVATQWETVYTAALIRQLRPYVKLAYFVQDYEPDFYVPEYPDLALKAERTYHLIKDQIGKTRWLQRMVAPYGGRFHRIPLGLNLDFYHDVGDDRPLQLLSLARPTSLRRNFEMVTKVFAEIHRQRPDITLALYGHGYDEKALPFPVKSYGALTDMKDVAAALNESTVLVDCSTFQGFGRPGLEAMACGTAAALTCEGGITQYAKHEHNCLLIDPEDQDDIVSKVLELFDDEAKRRRLIRQGYETAKEYSVVNEGDRTAALFRRILAGEEVEAYAPEHAGV